MTSALLVLDIGNTNTSAGLWVRGRVQRHAPLGKVMAEQAAAALQAFVRGQRVHGLCLCSVVPKENRQWEEAARALWRVEPFRVHHQADLGIALTYPRPETIGPDRLANAVAAAEAYGAPVIVADFGTALTFDLLTRRAGYIGGVIAPGLPLMFSYLAEKTALLPHIGPAEVTSAVGRSTEEAMRVGAQYGYRGMVREILAALRREPGLQRARVCATGGYAGWVMNQVDPKIPVVPELTLTGAARIWERTVGPRPRRRAQSSQPQAN
jgi:type III pantothenate kinase